MTGTGDTSKEIGGARTMGSAIASLRHGAGLSQRALADRIGMHQNYLGALERGVVHNPGLATVSRIADGLDVDIGVLAASFVRASPALPAERFAAERPPDRDDAYDGAQEMGSAIRLMRHRAELTQAQLSDKTGVHHGHMASIERGEKRSPGLRTIARITAGIAPRPDELSELVADFARVFTGELTVHQLRSRVPTTSGPPASLEFPLAGTGS